MNPKTQKEMARRYSLAHQKLFNALAVWKRETILLDSEGRHAQDFAHEVATLAETSEEILLTA